MEQEWNSGMEESLLPDGWSEGEDLFAQQSGAPTTDTAAADAVADGDRSAPKTYRLKVNHEEKEVTLSEEEVVARLQKSYAFDAIRERQEGARDYGQEIRQLKRLYPEMKEIPDEVAHLAAEGESLLSAYALWQGRESEKAAEKLREENRILRQNAAAAARAPVKGIGGGAGAAKKTSDFERGMDLV